MTANTQSQAIVRVVDDDPDVRRSWQFVIEGEGWNVLTYASALEFLEKDSPFTPGCRECQDFCVWGGYSRGSPTRLPFVFCDAVCQT